jgi:ribosomal protein S27AE
VTAKNILQRYCSKRCYADANAVDKNRTCPTCGTAFMANHRTHAFCGPKCQSKSRRLDLPPKQCAACGVDFQPRDRTQSERRRFCTSGCAAGSRWRCEAA